MPPVGRTKSAGERVVRRRGEQCYEQRVLSRNTCLSQLESLKTAPAMPILVPGKVSGGARPRSSLRVLASMLQGPWRRPSRRSRASPTELASLHEGCCHRGLGRANGLPRNRAACPSRGRSPFQSQHERGVGCELCGEARSLDCSFLLPPLLVRPRACKSQAPRLSSFGLPVLATDDVVLDEWTYVLHF